MGYWATIGSVVGVLVLCCAAILGINWAVFYFQTRPSASGGGKSAGYARGSRTPRAAEAEVHARTEAADNGPGGRPAALSGTTPEVIDLDLDGIGTGDLAQLDYLEAWRRAGCPAVWPVPVVPGKGSA